MHIYTTCNVICESNITLFNRKEILLIFLVAGVGSKIPVDSRLSIWYWLKRLLLAVTWPWRRVSALSVTESGRLSAAAADSKLTDSLGASNRHFGATEPRVGSSDERDRRGDTGLRWETPRWLLWRRSNGEDGQEGERIKRWGSCIHQAAEPPLLPAARIWEAREVGLGVVTASNPTNYY